MTAPGWTADELHRIDTADELRIAVRRADGSLRRALPIWVVCAGQRVYVRTWYRRDKGWFAHALASGRAEISVPGLRVGVTVHDVGAGVGVGVGVGGERAEVDAAYRTKYARYGEDAVGPMVADVAAATTLRLAPKR